MYIPFNFVIIFENENIVIYTLKINDYFSFTSFNYFNIAGMKVCGFTIIRNAENYGYPIKEAIESILPICDHFIVSVGKSEDNTLELIKSIPSDKIEIIETIWDDKLREGGQILAIETNKAFDVIPEDYDWCFYIQADEAMHEKYLSVVQNEMEKYKDDHNVEGLLFKYIHFYGSFNYYADSRKWYRREIRVIRNDKSIRSFNDAQGFRKNDKKLQVKLIDAYIYHYGWVRPPSVMHKKMKNFHKLWHSDEWIQKKYANSNLYDYSNVDSIKVFEGTHPLVMKSYIEKTNINISLDIHKKNFDFINNILYLIQEKFGWRPFEYRNYKII
jgi:hypothetical protein